MDASNGAATQKRSPFSLNILELIIAIGVGTGTWFGLRNILWRIAPWPYTWEYYIDEPLPSWFTESRQELFVHFAIPMAIIMGISAVFLFRGTLNQEVRYFTRPSNFAVASPIFLFLPLNWLSYLSLYCMPVGVISAFIGFGISYKTESKWGWIAAVVWNILWLIFASNYFEQWWLVYGD
jgi:hypothetical protein